MKAARITPNESKEARALRFIAGRSASCALTLAVVVWPLLLAGCGARRTPDLERVFAAARERRDKRPIIVIPGILGSQLVNRRTGEVVWPSVFRSSVDGLSLPLTTDLAANRDDLIAVRIVETVRLARLAPEVYVYYELLGALKNYGGYREGNFDDPPADGDRDTFYVFPYDWRRDNVESARELVRRVEGLKRKLGRPDLRFNIVAHSMGGLVARYAAMYGDADLPPDARAPQPNWAGAAFINKIFMFGTPNGGSAEALATLLEGYSVTEGLRRRVRLLRKLSREDVVSIPAAYQLLPHNGMARFLDGNLAPLEIDLYDPDVWRRYGWSALNNPDYRERYANGKVRDESAPHNPNGGTGVNGDGRAARDELDAFLGAVLRRAKRFHEALNATGSSTVEGSGGAPPIPLFAFGGDCEETLAAPLIYRDEKQGRWVTLTAPRALRTTDGRNLTRKEVTRAMYEPGDGRVTRRSLLGERLDAPRQSSFYNTTLPLTYAAFACDLHSDLQNNKTLQDNALTLLVSEAMR